MHVDESRSNDQSLGVDRAPGGGAAFKPAHRDDPIAANRDVALEPRIARAVDDDAAFDEDVERGVGWLVLGEGGGYDQRQRRADELELCSLEAPHLR